MGNKPGLILRENFSKETQTLIDERSFLKLNTTGVFVYRLSFDTWPPSTR